MRRPASTENANAILWKVEKAGVPSSHLFGTMHLTDERINALSPEVKQALAGARRLVLELDDISPAGFMKLLTGSPQMIGLMLYTDGRRLDQLLDAQDFRKVNDVLTRAGVPPGIGGLFRPWVATLLLSVSACEQRRMGSGLLPLDANLAQRHGKQGYQAGRSGDAEIAVSALADVPEPDQVEMLSNPVCASTDRIDDMLETMIQLYLRAQARHHLAPATRTGGAGRRRGQGVRLRRAEPADHAAISACATRRLRSWPRADAFIAVGALHLPGRQGLVTLFREAGYTVTRRSSEPAPNLQPEPARQE